MDLERISNDFLELAGEQRLNIMFELSKKNLNLSKLSDLLKATKSEVHRNVNRLIRARLIEKNSSGEYELTSFGFATCTQISSFDFISENRDFFMTHSLKYVESKFIHRLGEISEKKQINGFVRVLERWKKIHESANEYIFNILSEVPYSKEIIDIIFSKLENNVQIRSIFSENTIMPEERMQVFRERGFKKFVQNGSLLRKFRTTSNLAVLVTENESAIFFPDKNGTPDLSIMFTSTDENFHSWCYDYFMWCWNASTVFQESKIKS